jgi:hypothetical protein
MTVVDVNRKKAGCREQLWRVGSADSPADLYDDSQSTGDETEMSVDEYRTPPGDGDFEQLGPDCDQDDGDEGER